jgi:hypothetical protein
MSSTSQNNIEDFQLLDKAAGLVLDALKNDDKTQNKDLPDLFKPSGSIVENIKYSIRSPAASVSDSKAHQVFSLFI